MSDTQDMRVGLFGQDRNVGAAFKGLAGLMRPKRRCRVSSDFGAILDFQPQVLLIAEPIAHKIRPHLPKTLIVQVQTDLEYAGRGFVHACEADALCVSSAHVMNWHRATNVLPRGHIVATGFLPLDPFFRGDRLPLPFELPHIGLTVLYAPTHDERVSSAPMLAGRTIESLIGHRRERALVIWIDQKVSRDHPEWVAGWRQEARGQRHVHLVQADAASLPGLIRSAGVLVTDASPTALNFLAGEMPIVLIDNPARETSPNYDDGALVWAWRDMGARVERGADLSEAVERALNNPLAQGDRRTAYRQMLFGNLTDGRAGVRIAEQIDLLADDAAPDDAGIITSWPLLAGRAVMRRMKRVSQRKAAAL